LPSGEVLRGIEELRMSQERAGRIVGLSLGGLWLLISLLAALASDAPQAAAVPPPATVAAADTR
jgi:hypothetical protein